MVERQAIIASGSGLHARPAKLFVAAVQEKGIPVTISAGGGAELNAGSILALMGLGASKGTTVTLRSEADGAEQALDELAALLETDLDAV
ncbi:HPr family phosphocarrier protein [Microbacterium sp. C5A9]|uniref:HPr family phosphocarrier protein n=1 Tax=Microbacterium sp. C5A9 TaxID=2736663 RepID=UPI001F51CF79|nr:HPr family phosphocarrier protein [Microbacterium sp. C5A9]MCI1017473.1 HPr family phosphocarrier protein [Microbacterium sp. C5A9]